MSGQIETGHVETVSQPAPGCNLLHELVDDEFVFFSALFCLFVCLFVYSFVLHNYSTSWRRFM